MKITLFSLVMMRSIPEPPAETKKTYSVTQYNLAVERYLKNKVPDTWVHGIITQLNVRGRVAYVTIGEFEEASTKPRSVLQAFLWSSELEAYNIRFSRLPSPFELRVELKVSLLLSAAFYVPLGKFQPKIKSIDENYTLGELAQTRRKIIEALMKDGLLDKNKGLPFPGLPLSIGLITAPGSAAYRDFTTVLLNSGFAFDIFFHPSKMQGELTEQGVVQALKTLSSLELDLVCLVRGGGAKTDLVFFDSEKICRAIANFPVPVLTGIGHEIDNSIADMVAHADMITPTDCAKFLENKLVEAADRLSEKTQALTENWREYLRVTREGLGEKASILQYGWGLRQAGEKKKLLYILKEMTSGVRRAISGEKERIVRWKTGLNRGPGKLLTPCLAETVSRGKLLRSNWMRGLQAGLEALKFKEKILSQADPARQLKKGFSILRSADNRVIKNTKGLKAGLPIEAEVWNGYISAEIISTRDKT